NLSVCLMKFVVLIHCKEFILLTNLRLVAWLHMAELAKNAVRLAPQFDLQLDRRMCIIGCKLTAQHRIIFPVLTARSPIQGKTNPIENGRLPRSGISGNNE